MQPILKRHKLLMAFRERVLKAVGRRELQVCDQVIHKYCVGWHQGEVLRIINLVSNKSRVPGLAVSSFFWWCLLPVRTT